MAKLMRPADEALTVRERVLLFREAARDVLRAGLASASWITVDDSGARHKANNGFCTQTGNAHFTASATTASKSRLNFLSLLCAGHGNYVVNDAALAYMRTGVGGACDDARQHCRLRRRGNLREPDPRHHRACCRQGL
jgi:hypothetical protein